MQKTIYHKQYQLLIKGGHSCRILSDKLDCIDLWKDIETKKYNDEFMFFWTLDKDGVNTRGFVINANDIVALHDIFDVVVDFQVLKKNKEILEENLRKKKEVLLTNKTRNKGE
jgi:hypothetical protein